MAEKKQLYVLSKVMAKAVRFWDIVASAMNGGVNNFVYIQEKFLPLLCNF